MGQVLIDLATTFDYESPAVGSDPLDTPPFEFPSLLASTPCGGESNFDIFSSFSMGVAEIMTHEITPITTAVDQIFSFSTLPATVSGGITLSTDNEWVFIPSPNPFSFSCDVKASTPREGGWVIGG